MSYWPTIVVATASCVLMVYGIHFVQLDNITAKTNMTEAEAVQANSCGKLVPPFVQAIASLSILSAILGVPALLGGKVGDKGTILVIYSVVSLLLLMLGVRQVTDESEFRNRMNVRSKINPDASKGVKEDTQNIGKAWYYAVESYDMDFKATTVMDDTQFEGKCCGIDGPEDWYDREEYIPNSCCKESGCDVTNSKLIWTVGCHEYISHHYMQTARASANHLLLLTLAAVSVYIFVLVFRLYPQPYHCN